MQKFIYRSVVLENAIGMSRAKTLTFSQTLNEKIDTMAERDWELVEMTPNVSSGTTTHYVLIFKKPVLSAADLDR